jgi:molybdopterin-guanine dinucleotide biosynthesis protein A
MNVIADCGGIVISGGKSRRMGADKASLPFAGTTMLASVVETLLQVTSPVCVIASKGQVLPKLPSDVMIGFDENSNRGPLAGLLAGLKLLQAKSKLAFCASCDSPLLHPEVVRLVIGKLGEGEIAAPFDGLYWSPLCAVYRVELAERIECLSSGIDGPNALIQRSESVRVSFEELRRVDPDLRSFVNVNTPEEYKKALAISQERGSNCR